MDQHSNDNIVCEDEIVAYAEDSIPENQQIEKIEFSSEKQPKPSTEIEIESKLASQIN